MGRIIECMGRYASNPYYLEKVFYRIYSVEELCYYFCENTDLLEKDIVNTSLANWLETECGLRELSNRLYKLITTGGSLAQFVVTVLDYVQFCSPSELSKIEARLSESGGLTPKQRRKRRADYFLKSKRFSLAISEYEALLWSANGEEKEFLADVYHQMGVANANMFFFQKAAIYFKKAYDYDGDDRHRFGYVAAMRFVLKDMEFVRQVAQDPIMSAQALKLEEELEAVTKEWTESPTCGDITALEEAHRVGDNAFYEDVEDKVISWVEEYRMLTSE